MAYQITKKAIEVQMQRGTLDKESMKTKLDVFLLNGRISEEEYSKLVELIGSK